MVGTVILKFGASYYSESIFVAHIGDDMLGLDSLYQQVKLDLKNKLLTVDEKLLNLGLGD